jgi:hypothetical protein
MPSPAFMSKSKERLNVPPPPGAASKPSYGRFIPKEEIEAAQAFRMDSFGDKATRSPVSAPAPQEAKPPPPPPPHPRELLAAARQAGLPGRLARRSSQRRRLQAAARPPGGGCNSARCCSPSTPPLPNSRRQLAAALTRSVVQLAQQVVRTELRQNPEHIAHVAQEAVDALLLSARQVRLRVHPEDLPLVEAGALDALRARGATLLADPAIERGGCFVESDIATVDAAHRAALAPGCRHAGPACRLVRRAGRDPRGPLMQSAQRVERWQQFLTDLQQHAGESQPLEAAGKLVRVAGLVLEAAGLRLPVGAVCEIHSESRVEKTPVLGEVVGFAGDRALPDAHGRGAWPVQWCPGGAREHARERPPKLGAGEPPVAAQRRPHPSPAGGGGLLGRVVDAQGQPMDRSGPLQSTCICEPLVRRPINAMDRDPVRQPLDTGVRAINALLTVGRGQRLGLFAGTGVGKSVLLGMMARYTAGRRDRGRADRRAGPRGQGVHRGHPGRRRAAPLGGGGRARPMRRR